MEQAGEVRLLGGWAQVSFAEEFVKRVEVAGYEVFLSSYDSAVVFVQNRTAKGFEIHAMRTAAAELKGGPAVRELGHRTAREKMMVETAYRAFRAGALVAVLLGVASAFWSSSASAASAQAQATSNPNPGIVPNQGQLYQNLGAAWWQWAYSFDYADIPFLNVGGPVDASAGQSGHVWFLAGAPWYAPVVTRSGNVPAGVSLFLPLVNLVNDWPCPDPNFKPEDGETLEDFLLRTGNDYLPNLTDLFAEIDGAPLTRLSMYRATSPLFWFTADPAAVAIDTCITGTPQRGVAVGYWLLLTPLTPGVHTVHFGTPSWGQDVTYILTVTARH